MGRLYRNIARIQSGQKIDEERMLDILSRLADDALRYSDDDDRLADIPARDIEDALDWAISRILEAKDATILPLDEIADWDQVWLEVRHSDGDLLFVTAVTGQTAQTVSFMHGIVQSKPQHGKSWRCWAAKPTEEQRKAVKWDD